MRHITARTQVHWKHLNPLNIPSCPSPPLSTSCGPPRQTAPAVLLLAAAATTRSAGCRLRHAAARIVKGRDGKCDWAKANVKRGVSDMPVSQSKTECPCHCVTMKTLPSCLEGDGANHCPRSAAVCQVAPRQALLDGLGDCSACGAGQGSGPASDACSRVQGGQRAEAHSDNQLACLTHPSSSALLARHAGCRAAAAPILQSWAAPATSGPFDGVTSRQPPAVGRAQQAVTRRSE